MPSDSPGPIVLDQFLDRATFDDVRGYVSEAVLAPVDTDSSFTIWRRNAPGNPSAGATLFWSFDEQYPAQLHDADRLLLYPSGSPLDSFCRSLREATAQLSTIERDCVGLIATVYSYGPGARLIWHEDGPYLAAFAFYLSTDWTSDHGGQFAFKRAASDTRGEFIEALPNRLVMFETRFPHSILPVSAESPGRLSISGFLVGSATASAFLSRRET